MRMPSIETWRRSALRLLEAGVVGALLAFVAVPVDLADPKRYVTVLTVAMGAGFIMGLKKFITGYVKYDLGGSKPSEE